jgi:hypothetical protein
VTDSTNIFRRQPQHKKQSVGPDDGTEGGGGWSIYKDTFQKFSSIGDFAPKNPILDALKTT